MKNFTFALLIFIVIFLSFIFYGEKASSQGIILADNQKIIDIFRSKEKNKVNQLLQELEEYEEIIIHLGSRKVFERGSAFFYNTSQDNLRYFIQQLKKDNKKIYLWFLDSFGGKNFLEIYDQYRETIDANYSKLKELDLNYDGIIIDLEWINFGTKDNSGKYMEILKYLKNNFNNKEIYAFVSLVNDQIENQKRGYKPKEMLKYLDNIIVMHYLKDGGYYLKENKLALNFKKERLEELRNYYEEKKYKIAVSLQGGVILERNNNLYFIKNADKFNYKNKTEKIYEYNNKYHSVKGYVVLESFKLTRNDGIKEEIKVGEKIHFLKINKEKLVKKDDYIWEFFMLNDHF